MSVCIKTDENTGPTCRPKPKISPRAVHLDAFLAQSGHFSVVVQFTHRRRSLAEGALGQTHRRHSLAAQRCNSSAPTHMGADFSRFFHLVDRSNAYVPPKVHLNLIKHKLKTVKNKIDAT